MLNTMPLNQTAEGYTAADTYPTLQKFPLQNFPWIMWALIYVRWLKHIAYIKWEFARREKMMKHEVIVVNKMSTMEPAPLSGVDGNSGPELPSSKHKEESSITYKICWCLRPKWQVVSERHNLSWKADQRELAPESHKGEVTYLQEQQPVNYFNNNVTFTRLLLKTSLNVSHDHEN